MQDDTTNQPNPPIGGPIPGGMPLAPSEPTVPVGGPTPTPTIPSMPGSEPTTPTPTIPSMPGSEPTTPTPTIPSMPGSEPTSGGNQGGSTPPPTPGI